jgi:hypothetical protein
MTNILDDGFDLVVLTQIALNEYFSIIMIILIILIIISIALFHRRYILGTQGCDKGQEVIQGGCQDGKAGHG